MSSYFNGLTVEAIKYLEVITKRLEKELDNIQERLLDVETKLLEMENEKEKK